MKLFNFDNSYGKLPESFYQRIFPEKAPNPLCLAFNHRLAKELGLASEQLTNFDQVAALTPFLSGNLLFEGSEPIALAYAGHQFGNFVPQLGDGRAVLLGEHLTQRGERFDIQLKGSGRTRFSRGGDGKSALGPALREYIISEALHYLNIPTTRTLAVLKTGESVARESLIPGGLSVRVASSHVRIGTFEFIAALGDYSNLVRLFEYVLERHDSALSTEKDLSLYEKARCFFQNVCDRQGSLISQWMGVGFIHGVMNTDNTLISGESIDFGPCAFIDKYDLGTVFSSIDRHGRYAFGNQLNIIQWNLVRLAEALLPLFGSTETEAIQWANGQIERLPELMQSHLYSTYISKLGLTKFNLAHKSLAGEFLSLLESDKIDFTFAFRQLSFWLQPPLEAPTETSVEMASLFHNSERAKKWLSDWREAISNEGLSISDVKAKLASINPFLIPRNNWVEKVIQDVVTNNNLQLLNDYCLALETPFDENTRTQQFAMPDSEFNCRYRTFCGT